MDAIYIPVNAYHVERRAGLNEFPLGLGIEKGGYFAMGFKDSYRRPSWVAGKRFEAIKGEAVRVDAAAFSVFREYKGEYRAFPGVLPILSVGSRWRVEFVAIPKLPQTNGAVIFSWVARSF